MSSSSSDDGKTHDLDVSELKMPQHLVDKFKLEKGTLAELKLRVGSSAKKDSHAKFLKALSTCLDQVFDQLGNFSIAD